MTLAALVSSMTAILGQMDGLRRAYDEPPEGVLEMPCILVYARSGQIEFTPGGGKAIHNIVVEVHEQRNILQLAVERAKGWPDKLLAAVYHEMSATGTRFGGNASAVAGEITYEAGAIEYGSEVHYIVRFTIPVKEQTLL